MNNETDVTTVDATANADAVADAGPDVAPGDIKEGVTLSNEQYAALLDHVSSLESELINRSKSGSKDVQTLDNLINDAESTQTRTAPPLAKGKSLEEMTPEEVVGAIFQAVEEKYIKPLEVKVETLKLITEIDKVASKPGNEDFWEYADAVKDIAMKNPGLSIQRAYHLAKQEGSRKPSAQGDKGLNKKSELLYTLPVRPNITGGEKPGAVRTRTVSADGLSRRDAASAAFDAAVKGTGK